MPKQHDQTAKRSVPGTPSSKREARAAAQRRLNEAHADELRAYMVEEHEARGLTYQPRLTPGERAVREVQRLASEHPEVQQAMDAGLIG